MTALVLGLVALALMIWPEGVGGRALAGRMPGRTGGVRQSRLGRVTVPVAGRHLLSVVLVAGVGWAAPWLGLVGGLTAATAAVLGRGAVRRRNRMRCCAQIASGVEVLGRELRAGAAIPVALSAAKEQSGEAVSAALMVMDRDGGSGRSSTEPAVDVELSQDPVVGQAVRRLRAAWLLSNHHGVPLAGLVEVLGSDLTAAVAGETKRQALVAGPRLSGYLLSGLPPAGLILGTGIGARPLHVLLATGAGHGLLLAGVVLDCAGLLWTARISR